MSGPSVHRSVIGDLLACPGPDSCDSADCGVMPEIPETSYARTAEGAYIAYQVLGDGPMDLVLLLNGGVPIDLILDEPAVA